MNINLTEKQAEILISTLNDVIEGKKYTLGRAKVIVGNLPVHKEIEDKINKLELIVDAIKKGE